jgi:hypothetical protein
LQQRGGCGGGTDIGGSMAAAQQWQERQARRRRIARQQQQSGRRNTEAAAESPAPSANNVPTHAPRCADVWYALERRNILIPTYEPMIDASKKNCNYLQYLRLVAWRKNCQSGEAPIGLSLKKKGFWVISPRGSNMASSDEDPSDEDLSDEDSSDEDPARE